MRDFDISTFISDKFYTDQIKDAVFVATYKRHPTEGGFNFVIVRDNDEYGTQQVCFETGFTAAEIDFVQRFCVEQDASFHPVTWAELTDEVRRFMVHNLLPIEWHNDLGPGGVVELGQITLMYRGEVRLPYDRYDDPAWLAANGHEAEAAEILREREAAAARAEV